jgi:hypothetical protein
MMRVALSIAAIVSVLPLGAYQSHPLMANEGHHGRNHDQFHKSFYERLIRPDTGNPCCSSGDCRPTSGRMAKDHYEVKVNGEWVPVPWNKIVKETAPDQGYHVCAPSFFSQPHQLFCVVLPPES